MFRSDQIVTSTQLVRQFGRISKQIEMSHEPLLVSQRCGTFLVLVRAEFFESLMDRMHNVQTDTEFMGGIDEEPIS